MSYLKFFTDGLTTDLIEKAKCELGETDEIRTNALSELKHLINSEPEFVPCVENVFLLAFLRTEKFNVSKSFKRLKKYYEVKGRYSGIYTDFKPSDFKTGLEQNLCYILENRDQNNASVGILRVELNDIDKYPIEVFVSCALLLIDFLIQNEATQVSGHSIILDFNGFNLRWLKYYSSLSMHTMFKIVGNCMPVRIKNFHLINGPAYINVICSLFQRLLPEKLRQRVHIHRNLESLHKIIPLDILPEEYGGKQGLMSTTCAKKFLKVVFSQEDHFIKNNEYGFKGKTLRDLQKKK